MGGILSCFCQLDGSKEPTSRRWKSDDQQPSISSAAIPSGEWTATEESMIQEAAALLMLQKHSGGGRTTIPYDRSASLKYPLTGKQKQQGMTRSSSTRARSITDPVVQPQQIAGQEIKVGDLETNHFVLVHGGGFGAWCWYKTIALLEDAGFKVNSIDLTGSGIHSFDTNKITSLSQYVMPLINFLEKLGDSEKVILVGHDFGGACISYAMEAFPTKINKAVFLSAYMMKNGQTTLDMFSQQEGASDFMREAQIFLYANGKDKPPTAIELDKSLINDLLFNQSPGKDIALASVSLRPVPFTPVIEKLVLTESNYGSVARYYIETTEDNATPLPLQQSMCQSNPPDKIFRIKGSDHSPFFSKPQALHKILLEIARIPSTQREQIKSDQ